MLSSVRPYLTASVALAGAGVIAVAPVVAPPIPDIKVQAAPVASDTVQLSALEDLLALNPITAWVDVFATAFANGGLLAEALLENPAPALRQLIANKIGYAETIVATGQGVVEAAVDFLQTLPTAVEGAFERLSAGDFAGFVETMAQALILLPALSLAAPLLESGLLEIPVTMAQNFTNVLAALTNPANVLPLAISALGPVLGVINAFGDSVQLAIDAVGEGDPLAAIGALINTPAAMTDALINGSMSFPGLLRLGQTPIDAGLVQSLLITLPRNIANALGAVDGVPTDLFGGLSLFSETATAPTVGVLAAKGTTDTGLSTAGDPNLGSGSFVPVSVNDEDAGESGNDLNDAEGAAGDAGSGAAGAVGSDRTESLDPTAGSDGTDDLKDVESGDTSANGGTDLSDGNKATPSTTGDMSTNSGSNIKIGEAKPRPGVKKASAKAASAASSTDSGDE